MRTSSASSLRCLAAAALLGQLVAAGRSSGCDSQNATKVSTSDKDKTTSVNIGDRNYLLYVPIRYNSEEPAPLILSFHGAARDAEHQERLDQFNTTFFNKDYLVAYPNSVHVCDPIFSDIVTNDDQTGADCLAGLLAGSSRSNCGRRRIYQEHLESNWEAILRRHKSHLCHGKITRWWNGRSPRCRLGALDNDRSICTGLGGLLCR